MSNLSRRTFIGGVAATGALLPGVLLPSEEAEAQQAAGAQPRPQAPSDWYEKSFYLLHLDHHTREKDPVGRDADPAETARLIALSRPDVMQIHAKGAPGWTTYPSQIGHTPPGLVRDVQQVWQGIAHRDGVAYSIYYNLGRDGEIMRRRPEWNRHKADGTLHDRALCYHSGVAEGYLWPQIEEIIARYDPDGLWFDGSCFTITTCYCESCRARFRRENGLELPKTPDEAGWDAFKEMQRQIYREFLAGTARVIRARSPRCHIVVNFAHSLHMPEDAGDWVDSLSGDIANDVDQLSRQAHWYDGQAKPFDLMTTCFVQMGEAGRQPKPRGQIEQEMAIIVANGGRYHAWDNPTSGGSGLSREHMEALARDVAPFLRARRGWCLGERVPSVSLLLSRASHYAATRSSDTCFPDAMRHPAWRGLSETCRQSHLDYEAISSDQLARGEIRTGAIIAEDAAALSDADVEGLRAFVARGGTLMLTGNGVRAGNLGDLFGLQAGEISEIEEWSAVLGGQTLALRSRFERAAPLAGTEILLAGRDANGATHPLVTRRPIGRGEAIAILFPAFTPAAGLTVPDALRAWLLEQARPQMARAVQSIDAPATLELVLRRKGRDHVLHGVNHHAGEREEFRRFNPGLPNRRITQFAPVAACRVVVTLPSRPARLSLEPQSQVLEGWTWQNRRCEFVMPPFEIHQMVVFHAA